MKYKKSIEEPLASNYEIAMLVYEAKHGVKNLRPSVEKVLDMLIERLDIAHGGIMDYAKQQGWINIEE